MPPRSHSFATKSSAASLRSFNGADFRNARSLRRDPDLQPARYAGPRRPDAARLGPRAAIASSCSSATPTRPTARRNFWHASAPSIPTCATCPEATRAGRPRATPESRRLWARSSYLMIRTSWRHPTFSRGISSTIARRRGIAVVGWEVQVRNLDDYARKRDHPEERAAPRIRRRANDCRGCTFLPATRRSGAPTCCASAVSTRALPVTVTRT